MLFSSEDAEWRSDLVSRMQSYQDKLMKYSQFVAFLEVISGVLLVTSTIILKTLLRLCSRKTLWLSFRSTARNTSDGTAISSRYAPSADVRFDTTGKAKIGAFK